MTTYKGLKRDWNLTDEDETEVVVTFTYHSGTSESHRYGPPEDYDPGSDATVEIDKVVGIGGEILSMTKEDEENFATFVKENPEEVLPGEDPDYERDRREDYRSAFRR